MKKLEDFANILVNNDKHIPNSHLSKIYGGDNAQLTAVCTPNGNRYDAWDSSTGYDDADFWDYVDPNELRPE